jgi:hypothetical protein
MRAIAAPHVASGIVVAKSPAKLALCMERLRERDQKRDQIGLNNGTRTGTWLREKARCASSEQTNLDNVNRCRKTIYVAETITANVFCSCHDAHSYSYVRLIPAVA